MKEKILFIYRHGAVRNIILIDGKIVGPTEFLWGMNYLDKEKFEIKYVNAPREEKRRGLRKLFWIIDFIFSKIVKIGLPIEIYPLFKKEIEWSEKIICTNDQISLGILFWKLLGGLPGKKINCIIMSLPERIKYFSWCRPIVWLVSKLLQRSDVIITLSNFVNDGFIKDYQIDKQKLRVLYFGIDVGFWRPLTDETEDNFVLSIGNDMNRDYETLLNALPRNLQLKIITKKRINTAEKNVEVLSGISDEDVRRLYNQARFVVVPSIKLRNESSGLSCTLQAMACGKAVIVSDAPTLRELFVDGADCLFYRPEDPTDLNDKINLLVKNIHLREKIAKSGYQKVIQKYTCQMMGKRLESILEES